MKYIILILTIGLLPYHIGAQFDLSSHMMPDPAARQFAHPTTIFDSTIVVTLPGIFNSNRYKGISYADLIKSSNNVNQIDARSALDKAVADNHYQNYTELHGLSVHYTRSHLSISTGYNFKLLGHTSYPEELIKLGLEGNAQYIDQQISVGPSFALRSYHEVYLGLAKKIGKITLGGRFKLLSGIEDLSTERNQIKLTTNGAYYQTQFDNDYRINSSGVLEFINLNDFTVDFDAIRVSGLSDNLGYGVDLGLNVELSSKLNVSASILDIGSIRWTKRVQNYTSTGTYDFDGVDLVQLIDDAASINVQDSLYNILRIEESANEYTTSLPKRIHIAAQYELSPSAALGASMYLINHDGPDQWALGVQYRKTVSKYSLVAQYAYINEQALNLGLGIVMDLGWLKLFANSDNILGQADPLNSPATNFRIGASVHF